MEFFLALKSKQGVYGQFFLYQKVTWSLFCNLDTLADFVKQSISRDNGFKIKSYKLVINLFLTIKFYGILLGVESKKGVYGQFVFIRRSSGHHFVNWTLQLTLNSPFLEIIFLNLKVTNQFLNLLTVTFYGIIIWR